MQLELEAKQFGEHPGEGTQDAHLGDGVEIGVGGQAGYLEGALQLLQQVSSQLQHGIGQHQLVLLVGLLLDLKVQVDLFCDEHRHVPVLVVDLGAQSHEAEQEDPQHQAPDQGLYVDG